MTGFLKIRFNANGLLKNRIINTDSVDFIEPFDAPGGRYVGETRSRIFMKDGTKYDMTLTVDDIQKLLREAGMVVAEIQSMPPPEAPAKKVLTAPPATPIAFYKRSTLIKPQQPDAPLVKSAPEAAGKPLPPAMMAKGTSAAKPPAGPARKPAETVRG